MDKLKMQTPNLTDKNIQQIAELFPNVMTETKDEDGNIKKAVDFDLLKQSLSDVLVDDDNERFRLDWPGKKASLLKANTPINETLRPCREESVDFDTTENVYIEGDNFEVLKILQESYLGKIKMIYIDPPYNTGNDFIYKDDFKVGKDEYEEEIGAVDEDGEKLFKNTDSNGRFHSDWLSMMYERLVVARDLLKEDGVTFISIDDNEVHNLRKVCDEIFGEENFIGLFCRKTKSGGGSASGTCAVEHDYVLVFAKNNGCALPLMCEFGEEYLKRYKERDENGPFFWDTMERSSTKTRPYTITAPDGSILSGKWFRSEDTFKKDLENGEVRFLPKGVGWSVQFKQRLSDGKKLRTIIEDSDLTNKKYRSLNQELEGIVGCNLGHPPKTVELLKTLIYSVLSKAKDDDILLDFFAGSATTAHAVIELNAKDNGNRKFIMVQLPEPCDENSEAFKVGYKTVAEIGKERIRRAGKKIKEELEGNNKQLKLGEEPIDTAKLDIGFRVYKTDSTNMKDVYYHPEELQHKQLSFLESNIKEDRTPDDLLTQVILDLGLELSLPIEKKAFLGNTVFIVQTNALIACFDDNINFKIVDEIAELKPFKVVFKDASFTDDKDRINVEERFKRLSPGTVITVM